jgi:NACHT domain
MSSIRHRRLLITTAVIAALTILGPLASITITFIQYKGVKLVWVTEKQLEILFNAGAALGALGAAIFAVVPPLRQQFLAVFKRDASAHDAEDQKVRHYLLKCVESTWVVKRLELSLHKRLIIELDKEESLDHVDYPWHLVLETKSKNKTILPPGTRIMSVFERSGNGLLMLGEPGSGKTTMLIDLARSAIARAEKDKAEPIPIVLSLSAWSDDKQTIEDWVVGQLTSSLYKLNKNAAQRLVEQNNLLLLLDGLDEVAINKRGDCVKALNRFRQTNALTRIAVCSRTSDYSSLATKLQMPNAVVLQPLSPRQVYDYLEKIGSEVEGLSLAIKKSPVLLDIAKSPLMLNLMTLTYRGLPAESIRVTYSNKGKANDLIHSYVLRMLERTRREKPYPDDQSMGWLSWLARVMWQKVFFIDQMQPFLLLDSSRFYFLSLSLLMMLVAHLYVRLNLPLINRFMGDNYFSELSLVALYGFPALMGTTTLHEAYKGIRVVESWNWSWEKARRWSLRVLILSMFLTLFIWLLIEFRPIIIGVLLDSSTYGLLGAIIVVCYALFLKRKGIGWPNYGLFGFPRRRSTPISLSSYEYLKRVFLYSMLIFYIVVGLGPPLLFDWMRHPHDQVWPNIVKTSQISGICGLFFVSFFLFLGGLNVQESKEKVLPNQGIWLSRRNAIKALILTLPVGIVIFSVMDRISTGSWLNVFSGDWLDRRLLQMLVFTLTLSFFVSLIFGGFAWIQHYVLRVILFMRGKTPLNYQRFLDFASDRVLLRKIGGGYEFVHEYVREYFESMNDKGH